MREKEFKDKAENENYISLGEAAKIYGCTQKHMNLIARRKKLKARKIGRNWMTTLEWLKEYTKKVNLSIASHEQDSSKRYKIRKIGPLFKNIVAASLVAMLLFSFFSSAYVASKNHILQIPEPIRVVASGIREINLGRTFTANIGSNLASIIQNIEQSKSENRMVNIIQTIIKGIRRTDRSSNEFFGGIFNSVFVFLDNLFGHTGNFAINIIYTAVKSTTTIPKAAPICARNIFITLNNLVSDFSITSLLPFSYNLDVSEQSLISTRDLYRKLKELRELMEGKTIVITKTTQQINEQIVKEITNIQPIQKEITTVQGQDMEVRLAVFKNEILAQIATDVTDFQSKIGSQIITQNNYYYAEAAKTARFDGVFLQDITFNENVTMEKGLSVAGDISIVGEINASGDLTIGSDLIFADISAGRVGINTISPGAMLDIQDDDSNEYLFAVSSASTGDLFSIANSGNVGIGTIPTDYSKLYVSASATDLNGVLTNIDSYLIINPNAANGDFSNIYSSTDVESDSTQALWRIMGDSSTVRNYGSGNINIVEVVNSWGEHNGAGTITHLAGYESENYGDGTNRGKITNAHNYYGYAYYYDDMNVTNNYGIRIDWSYLLETSSNIQTNYGAYIGKPTIDATSTIGTNYGLYLGDQAVGSTSYAIYSNGGQSYFAGNFGIGDTVPGYALSVDGTASISDDFYLGDNLIVGDVSVGGVSISGNFEVSGNVELGDATADLLVVTSYVGSDLIPNTNTYSLGSTNNRWRYGYFDEITVATISATGSDIGGTTNSAFILNSDYEGDDAEDSNLTFERGTPVTNASLKWDSTNDRFDFNFPLNIQGTMFSQGASISDDLTIGDNITFSDSVASISSVLTLESTLNLADDFTIGSGSYSHIIKNSDAEGLAGADLRIGLDESNRTIWIGDKGDIDTDFGLTAQGNPTLYIFGAATSVKTYLSAAALAATTSNFDISAYSKLGIRGITADLAAGNVITMDSASGIELTDTDAKQSWLYVEPKVRQTGTAAFDAIYVDATSIVSLGDGSTGTGNNFLRFASESIDRFRIDLDGNLYASGSIETENLLSAAHASVSDDLTVGDNITLTDSVASFSDDFYVGNDMIFFDVSADTIYSSASWEFTNDLDVNGTASSTFAGDLDIEGDVNIGGGDLYVDASSGRVGIGTTAPGEELHVMGEVRIQATVAPQIKFYEGTTARWTIGNDDSPNNAFVFSYGDGLGDEKMVIEPGGYVGIGITDPTAYLHVYTGAVSNGTALLIESDDESGDSGLQVKSYSTGATHLIVTGPGNVGIGTTSPDYLLDVAGQITASSSYINGLFTGVHASVSDDLTIGDNITFTDLTASISSNLVVDGVLDINGTASSTFAGDLDIEGDVNIGGGDLYVDNSSGYVGIGTIAPNTNLSIYNGNESTTQTNFTQALTNAGINIITDDNETGAYTSGIFWSTQDNNPTKPKTGIYTQITGSGTNLYLGTSGSYATGITTNIVINPSGSITIPTSAYLISTGNDTSQIQIYNTNTGNMALQSGYSGADIVFNTTSTATYDKTFIMTAEGNFGINDSVPGYALSVDGTASISDDFYVGGDDVVFQPFANSIDSFTITSASGTLGDDYAIFSVDSTNERVGIGTTSPQVTLDIPAFNAGNSQLRVGSMEFQPLVLNNAFIGENLYWNGGAWKYRADGYGSGIRFLNGAFIFESAPSGTAGSSASVTNILNVSDGSIAVVGAGQAYLSLTGSFGQVINQTGDLYISNNAASSNLIFRNNSSTEYMRIGSTGNVGVGDNSPGYKLSVDGTASISDDFYVGDNQLFADISANTIYSSASWEFTNDLDVNGTASSTFAGDLDVEGNINIGGNDLYVDSSTGYIGIGTNAPATNLDVNGSTRITGTTYIGSGAIGSTTGYLLTSGANFYIGSDIANGTVTIVSGNNSATIFYADSSGNLSLGLNYPIKIDTSGRVGIGDSVPAYTLSVDGTASISDATYLDSTLNLADDFTIGSGSYSHIIKNSDAEGLAGADLRIGLDESNRTLILMDKGDIDADGALAAQSDPTLMIVDGGSFSNGIAYYGWNRITQANSGGFTITALGGLTLRGMTNDTAAGNNVIFDSASGKELTDSDAKQAWLYVEPKVNQTGTAAFDAIYASAAYESVGDGSTGEGNNMLRFTWNSADIFRIDTSGNLYASGSAKFDGTASSTFAGDLDIEGDVNIGGNDWYVDAGTGHVGIGTSAPDSTLSIGDNLFQVDGSTGHLRIGGTPSATTTMQVSETFTDPGIVSVIGTSSAATLTTTTNTTASDYGGAFYAYASPSQGTVNAGNAVTLLGYGIMQGEDGGIASLMGGYFILGDTASGSITNIYGLNVNMSVDQSSASNSYALMLSGTGDGNADNSYGVYQTAGDKNYFADPVGIGTTTPFAYTELEVNGDIMLMGQNWGIRGNNANADLAIEEFGGTAEWTDANIRFYIAAGGNVGIKDYTPTEGTLTVGGTIYLLDLTAPGTDIMCWDGSGGSTIGDCSSLRKYKENIEDLQLGLETILQLQPKTFYWKQPEDGSDINPTQDLGFIAEDVEAINPLLTTHRNGELRGVRYEKLSAVLVNAIKEQQNQIASLSAQVASLMNMNLDGTAGTQVEISHPVFPSFSLKDLLNGLKELGIVIENGIVKISQLAVKALIVEKNPDPAQSSIGEGVIKADQVAIEIRSNQIMASSKIFITFRNDYGSRWWINHQEKGIFTINIAEPAAEDLRFDWWIVQTEPVEITETAGITTPVDLPADLPAEVPMGTEAGASVEEEIPSETLVETTIETPSESPSDTPSETPTEPATTESLPAEAPTGAEEGITPATEPSAAITE